MAKKIPVKICILKQNPSKEPKFHMCEIFEETGRSTNELFKIFNNIFFFS